MSDPLPPPLPSVPKPPALWRQTLEAHEDLEAGGVGIGGWLILYAISLIVAMCLRAFALLVVSFVFIKPGIWRQLTTPGTTAYHPMWSVAIIYETTGNALFFLLSLLLIGLFFMRRKTFRTVTIINMVATMLFLWGDYILCFQIPAVRLHNADAVLQGAIRTTISAAIWVPYFLVSERVKKTFVK